MNFYITYHIALYIAALAVGYLVGRKQKVAKLDGDICIVHDEVDSERYIFLRLNTKPEELEKHDYVQFNVVLKKSSDRE